MQKKFKIGFLGYGNLGKAISKGILGKSYTKNDILIYSPSIADKNKVDGFIVAKTPNEILENCEIAVLAVKPQTYRENISKLIHFSKNKMIISVMAGIFSSEIKKMLENSKIKVYRTMPNTPCIIKKGVTAIEKISDLNDKEIVYNIFNSIGVVIEVEEDKFDIISAISGSGPAFIEYFIKAMIDIGVEKGLDYNIARKAVVSTFKGTASLVEKKENVYIDDLIDSVCSKGGMTIAGLDYMKSKDIDIIIKKGIRASKKRSEELASIIE